MSKLVWAIAAVIAIFSFVNVGTEAEAVHAPEASRLWKSAKADQLEESEVLLRNRRQAQDIVSGLLNCILAPIRALINGSIGGLVQNLLGEIVGLVCSLVGNVNGVIQNVINGLPDLGALGQIKVVLNGLVVDLNAGINLQLDNLLKGLRDLLGDALGDVTNLVCPNGN